MRVVFDSNVLLAALLFPEGRAAAAVGNILDGKDDLVLSPPIFREILSVLARKFSRDREELSRVAVVLGEMGEIVDPSCRVEVFRDEPDNRILEYAVEGKADVISGRNGLCLASTDINREAGPEGDFDSLFAVNGHSILQRLHQRL